MKNRPITGFKPVPRECKYLRGLWQRLTRGDLVTLKRGKVYKVTSLTKNVLGVVQRVEGVCVWVCDDPNQLYEVEYEI
jgi:hypothetical protein